MKYHVIIKETHYSTREVEAESEEVAIELAKDIGTEILCEYSHSAGPDEWEVKLVD